MAKIIRLTEKDLTKLVKRVIKEQSDMTTYNYNMAVQCFLNKKGIKDDSGQTLKMDGSIGNYPKSKTAQAIVKYQSMIGVDSDGVWGPDTMDKMPNADKTIYKQCKSDNGDIFDKGAHWLGLD
jgi:murein L,D-transpeptidase YcbB/YkuD